jgi:hypothetical protein
MWGLLSAAVSAAAASAAASVAASAAAAFAATTFHKRHLQSQAQAHPWRQ